MKQKIVIKVEMSTEKSRSKALKIAAEAIGVESVALEGSKKSRVVVIGENVDSARLISSLSSKVGPAEFISIAEVKPKSNTKEKEKEKIRKEEAEKKEKEKIKKEEAAKKEKMRKEEAAKKVKATSNEKKKEEKETKSLINLLRARLLNKRIA